MAKFKPMRRVSLMESAVAPNACSGPIGRRRGAETSSPAGSAALPPVEGTNKL